MYSSELQWKDVCVGVTRSEGRNKRRKNVTCLHYPCPLCSLQCQDLRGLLRNFPKQAKATIAAQVGNSDCSYQFIKTQFFVQAPELLVLQSQLVGDGYIKVVLAPINIFFPSLCFLVQQKYFFCYKIRKNEGLKDFYQLRLLYKNNHLCITLWLCALLAAMTYTVLQSVTIFLAFHLK